MTMSQAATEPQAGPMSLSNGCEMDAKHLRLEPMDLSAGPATSDDKMPDDDHAGQLCRRSTRVSALKAAEKIKLKDDVTGQDPGPAQEQSTSKQEAARVDDDEPPLKKQKITENTKLDQMSHTFYIQQQSDGTIVEIDEGSDISSLNEVETAALKAAYEKAKAKEPSEETLRERQSIVKQLEAELRREEADLTLMRKIQSSQLIARQAEQKKLASASISNTNAYKPPVAGNKNGATNKQNGAISNDALKILLTLTADQQKEFIIKANKTNPQVVQQLVQALAKNSSLATQAQLQQLAQSIQAAHLIQKVEAAPAKPAEPKPADMLKSFASATPQQRAAQARQAFRLQADKQLQQLAVQKSSHADLFFIPNPNQADFLSLVALDIIVQRIMKDKAATADVTEGPYECEECKTDFTTSWKAIGIPGDMHVYCEACVKASQKKKALKDHTTFLRKAFNKVSAQEKDFEKQIADGKLEQVLSQAMANSQQMAAAAMASTSSNHKTNGTSTPSKSSVIPNTSKISAPSMSSSTKKHTSSSNPLVNMLTTIESFEDLQGIFPNERTAYLKLIDLGFFERNPDCFYCGKVMKLRWRKEVPEWRCKETKTKDCSCRSLRTGTWFHRLQLSPRNTFFLIYLHSKGLSPERIASLLEITQPSTAEYIQLVREICFELEKVYQPIGGAGKIVEIDEVTISVRKGRNENDKENVKILLGFDPLTSRCFAQILEQKDDDFLLETLNKKIDLSSTFNAKPGFHRKYPNFSKIGTKNQMQMQMQMLVRSNPMMAAMMSNPAMMQMYNPMMMQMMNAAMQQAMQANSRSSNSSSQAAHHQQSSQQYAMMLAQAAMQSAGGGASSGNTQLSAAQMATISQQLMQNPQLQRQFQELLRLKQGSGSKK